MLTRVTNLPPGTCANLFQPLLFNTLQVRSAIGAAQRRKLSFKNVSNVVVQLLHSIKYSMEVPFSNIALQSVDMKSTNTRKVKLNLINILNMCDFTNSAYDRLLILTKIKLLFEELYYKFCSFIVCRILFRCLDFSKTNSLTSTTLERTKKHMHRRFYLFIFILLIISFFLSSKTHLSIFKSSIFIRKII